MAVPCFAGEVAVLKNGFTIEHQWREVVGDVTRLYTSADGSNFIDVPTDDIEHFEAAPDAPVPMASMSASSLRRFRERRSYLLRVDFLGALRPICRKWSTRRVDGTGWILIW